MLRGDSFSIRTGETRRGEGARSKRAIIVVTHAMGVARTSADRIIFSADGKTAPALQEAQPHVSERPLHYFRDPHPTRAKAGSGDAQRD